jgi:hypothetical protein
MNIDSIERWAIIIVAAFGIRITAKYRADRKERTLMALPLVDPIQIETAFAPRPADNDDADVLAEVRNTFLHLNRRAYAEEFFGLDKQLTTWHNQLPKPAQKATFRRALLRLLASDDRWLQLVGAKTCASLNVKEAAEPLRVLLDSIPIHDGDEPGRSTEAHTRYQEELEAALMRLKG